MAETYTIIHEEIEDELQNLKKMQLGADSYKVTVDGVTKLIDREIELKKMENERLEAIERREHDAKLKMAEMDIDKKDRWARNVLTFLGIAVPAGIGAWAFLKSMKFEEVGTITTEVGKSALRGLFSIFTKGFRL